MALTGKKRKFALAVLAGKSNKDAAIVAGYSVATASQAGSRLLKDKAVAAYLVKGKDEREKARPVRGGAPLILHRTMPLATISKNRCFAFCGCQ